MGAKTWVAPQCGRAARGLLTTGSQFFMTYIFVTNLLSLSLQPSWRCTPIPVRIVFFREISKRQLSA